VLIKLFFTRRAAAKQYAGAAKPLTLESALTSTNTTAPSKSRSFTPVAVVTGGARGIGLACVKWFLAHGYQVAMLDTETATLKQTEQALNDSARVLALQCDVSIPAQVQAAIDQVEKKFGRIDALVNNAGVAVFKPIGETTFEEFRYVLGTNLDGAFLCSQACIEVMKKNRHGSIVNVASISGYVPARYAWLTAPAKQPLFI